MVSPFFGVILNLDDCKWKYVSYNINTSHLKQLPYIAKNCIRSHEVILRRIQKRRNCNGNASVALVDRMTYIEESRDMVWRTWTEGTGIILGIIGDCGAGIGNSREIQLYMETSRQKRGGGASSSPRKCYTWNDVKILKQRHLIEKRNLHKSGDSLVAVAEMEINLH